MSNDKGILNDKNKRMPKKEKIYDIYDRSFVFAVGVASFLSKIKADQATSIYKHQLIRSSSSIGANLAEADGSLSKKDFVNKVGIARREARESKHWLKLIHQVSVYGNRVLEDEIDWLINESHELVLILSAIILKAK